MYYISGMIKNTDGILSTDIGATRFKHVALTKYLKRNWERNPNVLKRILYNCDVSEYIGALPPQLRVRVPREQIATVTAQFRENLENWLIRNSLDLRAMDADRVYELPEIGNLFNTKCTLFARGINVYGVNPWSGSLGFVCKMSFPEIDAHYALKLYYDNLSVVMTYSHGPWFEVGTALAANKAEPRDNVPMYMASLKYEKYLLSQWAGDKNDGVDARKNKNTIFVSRSDEDEARNRRQGRRIDWGETYLTNYGSMSYRARKLYRQVMNLDAMAVKKSIACARTNLQRKDVDAAMELAGLVAWYDDITPVSQFLAQFDKSR